MNFFESQDDAQRRTRLLLVLFFLAILSIAALANLAVYLVLRFQTLGTVPFDLKLALTTSGVVLLLVLLGSAYRVYSLKRGGEAIAAALGGQLVVDGGTNEHEQRLINVVEEMAIASGLPVPTVYLLEEEGINAFAAGYQTGDAVIGVTKGAVLNLTRDQLQGVVAHEFSHILNGDMRLNIRLVGLLHGILMLSVAGRLLLQTRSGVARRSSAAFPVMFFGMSLFVIGYTGKFFGDLIKAAVSRQREFLADASAVQFTRNANGIAGALKRIGGHAAASNVHHRGAEEFSHLYFSNGFKQAFFSMLATHPPLEERITRIEPGWSGEFLFQMPVTETSTQSAPAGAQGFSSPGTETVVSSLDGPEAVVSSLGSPEAVVSSLSDPEAVQLDVARNLIDSIPADLRTAVREPYSARAVVYLLFLQEAPARREKQLAVLKQDADLFVRSRLSELMEATPEIAPESRLPLLELALPALRQLSVSEFEKLKRNLAAIQKAGQPVSLSDWALSYYLNHHMQEAFGQSRARRTNSESRTVAGDIGYLLSVLAHSDRESGVTSQQAFAAGQALLPFEVSLEPKTEISSGRLKQSVEKIASVKPLQKPRILKAFVAVISADRKASTVEAELLRCFADAIDCPLPPLAL